MVTTDAVSMIEESKLPGHYPWIVDRGVCFSTIDRVKGRRMLYWTCNYTMQDFLEKSINANVIVYHGTLDDIENHKRLIGTTFLKPPPPPTPTPDEPSTDWVLL